MTTKSYFSQLRILSGAMLFFLIMVTAIIVILKQTEYITPSDGLGNVLIYIMPFLALLGLIGSKFIFRYMIAMVNKKTSLQQKLNGYSSANIVKLALIEGPTLASLVFYFVSGKYEFLIVAGLMIVVFSFNLPSKSKVLRDLKLSAEEQEIVDNPLSKIVSNEIN